MYYKLAPTSGQLQSGSAYPEGQNPARADIYRMPELESIENSAQAIEWMRKAAIVSNDFDYGEVMSRGQSEKTFINSIGKVAFGAKLNKNISPDALTTMMLHAEAKLGGEIFREDGEYEFFCMGQEWVLYKHPEENLYKYLLKLLKLAQNEPDESEGVITKYTLNGPVIRKSFQIGASGGMQLGTMQPGEISRLEFAAKIQQDLVGNTLYPKQHKYYIDWQETQRVEQQAVAAETAIKQQAAAEAIMKSNLVEPGDFAWAS